MEKNERRRYNNIIVKKKKIVAKIEDERSFLSFVKYKGKNNRGPLIFILTLY